MGGTSDGVGGTITLLAYAFYRVSMSGILSHRKEEVPARLSL